MYLDGDLAFLDAGLDSALHLLLVPFCQIPRRPIHFILVTVEARIKQQNHNQNYVDICL